MSLPLPNDYNDFLLQYNGLEAVYSGLGLSAPLARTQNVAISSERPSARPSS
jgi:hypothetical protein